MTASARSAPIAAATAALSPFCASWPLCALSVASSSRARCSMRASAARRRARDSGVDSVTWGSSSGVGSSWVTTTQPAVRASRNAVWRAVTRT
ncbi:hypothetical protein D7V93_43660 [Corallococcus llansteffanensis]|uniref:Secreted protein n=1 Tax=Corallococcus llansteffanensis TaxID=2316731 RepID=A0A3A8N2G3_9BACT|nr:hypothetical protein D7V93_43660 [Corallococcus llansteffanensis]